MKHRIVTNSIRTIRRSFLRFLSLAVMSMLGVFAFSGLQATSPDMIRTLDVYLDQAYTYDIQVVSTMGISSDDIEQIKKCASVQDVQGAYIQDAMTTINDKESVVRIQSVPETINRLTVIQGTLPVGKNEIVVEEKLLENNRLKIGDTIQVETDGLKEKTLKITGTVDSSLYYNNVDIDPRRGNTSIGTGTVNYYAFAPFEAFDHSIFSCAYITVKGATELVTGQSAYNELCQKAMHEIEKISQKQEEKRYKELCDEAMKSIEWQVLENYGMIIPDMVQSIYDQQMEEISQPRWNIYDRNNDSVYSDYIDDAQSIANLSKVFPTVFFAVAVLVSLVSMNRMVEEDRLEIGTLKSMGFPNRMILSKYIVFSLAATLSGCMVGSLIGLWFLPTMINSIYKILFDVPNFQLGLYPLTTGFGFLITLLCVCGTTVWTVYKVLREKPSELMRPKVPKSGQRVWLEKIPWIWNRLKFSQKITIRNLIRYKKRISVTIGGIAGCCALMLCGFGIRDSIVDIPSAQYGDIFLFDGMIYTDGSNIELHHSLMTKQTSAEILSADVKDTEVKIYIMKNDKDLSSIACLKDMDHQLHMKKGQVIITEKLSELKGLKPGDKLTMIDVDQKSYTYTISGVAKNYIDHIVFVDDEDFEAQGGQYQPNIVFFRTGSIHNSKKKQLSKQLMEQEGILNVTFQSDLVDRADDMLKSLNKVVFILIVLAALLSFVVLYNLSNINISERRREIATLKVLGFYDSEVDDYIVKENRILTFIGIILGLSLGILLTRIVVSTVEIERCRFMQQIHPMSFFCASALSCLFTWIVNRITHIHLKHIDMIDSLKSVE